MGFPVYIGLDSVGIGHERISVKTGEWSIRSISNLILDLDGW